MVDEETLIDCRSVSKRFCRSLKKSLWYGMKEIGSDLLGKDADTNSRQFDLREGEFWAVDDVSFQLKRGEAIGLIGHNGAGKTTLLKMLNGLIKPDGGEIEMRGRVGALIALSAGFNPILTGRENIYANASILGLTRREINEIYDSIVDFAEVEEAIDAPVRTYSSGMQARLGFAVAAHIHPDILLIDEVLAVGDVSFRNKCLRFVEGIRDRGGAYILVTHSFNQVLSSCPRALLMDKGKLVAEGKSSDVIEKALSLQTGVSRKEVSKDRSIDSKGTAKEAWITRVSLERENGGELKTGDPAMLTIDVESVRTIENCAWAFYIFTSDGAHRLVSKQSGDQNRSWTLKKGQTSLRARIEGVWLAARSYNLRLALSADKQVLDTLGYEDEPVSIEVKPPDSSRDSLRGAAVGDVVWMEVSWE